jgi:hypothetical protein
VEVVKVVKVVEVEVAVVVVVECAVRKNKRPLHQPQPNLSPIEMLQ